MIVYLSGPISGLDMVKVRNQFKTFEECFILQGYEVINPMEIEHSHDLTWESYMRRDITAMMKCQAIYMLPGWEKSKGAQIELQLAKSLNFIILPQ